MTRHIEHSKHVSRNDVDASLVAGWTHYRKKFSTPAIRMSGPFTVETREGTLTCPDGYLAVDSNGWPYPIAADEFERIYEPGTGRPHVDRRSDGLERPSVTQS